MRMSSKRLMIIIIATVAVVLATLRYPPLWGLMIVVIALSILIRTSPRSWPLTTPIWVASLYPALWVVTANIAWLAHRTLPYAFAGAGERPAAVSCVLTSPDGDEVWRFGPPGADSAISGPAGVFCRVAVRRLDAADSGLRATGPHAATALRLLRTYAA